MNEFDLINTYFNWANSNNNILGVGDDCALVPGNQQLATSVDTLVAGVHFLETTPARDIAYKALAVNLSDLAAMGAKPYYFTLALTLPKIDHPWLEEFSSALKSCAQHYQIDLVGGDTTQGPLSITINITGTLPADKALLRSGAQVGDQIFVSNTLGDAALAWWQIQQGKQPSDTLLAQLHRPQPQVELGQELLEIANSCIDISDGLEQDLSHILKHSGVGAQLDLEAIPLSAEVSDYINTSENWCMALAGGDDYELCFTAPTKQCAAIEQLGKTLGISLSNIGVITQTPGLQYLDGFEQSCASYQHFS